VAADAFSVTKTASFTVTILLPVQPVLAGCSVPAPGQFRLPATTTNGLTYTLPTFTNLVNWEGRTNLVADPGGAIDCAMAMGTNAPARFYRLRWP
jgi:hypothetical protein